MTEMERIWTRLKKKAHELSFDGRRIEFLEATSVVLSIVQKEKASRPMPEALQYLAAELISLVDKNRQKNDSSENSLA